jgi:uncharacterized membrane protein YphA (DoxX/SURF4 family)
MEIGASLLVLNGFFCWAGALILGCFTLFATFVANRFLGDATAQTIRDRKFLL